ncbi:tetratricopeptide repeat protein, partial [Aeromonas allosaccharophila]
HQALDLYHKAKSDHGSQIAKYRIGVMYLEGLGVEKDYQQAVLWFRRAALVRKGQFCWDNAMYCKWVAQNITLAISWYSKGEYRGNALAQYTLGQMYEEGLGEAQNYGRAVGWYRKAAEQGDVAAQNSLGRMYEKGQGVEEDYQQAAVWFRKAAEQGDAGAQYHLGLMYHDGKGVERDGKQAVAWCRKAAEQGYNEAQATLGGMYEKGWKVPQDYKQAYAWYSTATANGGSCEGCRDSMAEKLSPSGLEDAQALATQYFEQYQPKQ